MNFPAKDNLNLVIFHCVCTRVFLFPPSLYISYPSVKHYLPFSFSCAFFYLCLHIFWPCYITSLIIFSFLFSVSLRCCKWVASFTPIYDYIPTWYHEFYLQHAVLCFFCFILSISYQNLFILYLLFFFFFPRFFLLSVVFFFFFNFCGHRKSLCFPFHQKNFQYTLCPWTLLCWAIYLFTQLYPREFDFQKGFFLFPLTKTHSTTLSLLFNLFYSSSGPSLCGCDRKFPKHFSTCF